MRHLLTPAGAAAVAALRGNLTRCPTSLRPGSPGPGGRSAALRVQLDRRGECFQLTGVQP